MEECEEKYEGKYGFVALLDVLGVSTISSVKQAKAFLKKWDKVFKLAKRALRDEATRDKTTDALFHVQKELSPEVFRIGDTIVLSWAMDKEELAKEVQELRSVFSNKDIEYPHELVKRINPCYHASVYLPHIAVFLDWLISAGLKQGLLLRGALAIGDYVVGSTEAGSIILVGPAVSDAASWYEKADWFGVVLTPSCGMVLMNLAERKSKRQNIDIRRWFVKHNVALKGKEKMDLWSLSWPYFTYHACITEEITPLSAISSSLLGLPIPRGTEGKYSNSIEFFQWYGEKIYPEVKENMRKLRKDLEV